LGYSSWWVYTVSKTHPIPINRDYPPLTRRVKYFIYWKYRVNLMFLGLKRGERRGVDNFRACLVSDLEGIKGFEDRNRYK
jgi:hypothetical protein